MTDAVGSSSSSMTDAVVGSSPSGMTDAVVGSSPSSMTDAVVGSSSSSMSDAVVLTTVAVLGSSPSGMTDAVVGSSPSCMSDAVVGSSHSSMTDADTDSSSASVADPIVLMTVAVGGSSLSSMTDAVVRSSPSSMTDSIVGSSPSSMTDHADQSVFPDQHKERSSVESKYQQRDHGKRAKKILGVNQVHTHRASEQSEYLLGDETNAKHLSHKHQKTSKKTSIKGQEKSLLRDIDGENKSHSVASKSQSVQENENDYNPCRLKDETEDPEVSESMENKDNKVSFSIQGHNNNETYKADRKGKEKRKNLKNANLYSEETVDKESLSQHGQKGGQNTDGDGKEELLCNHCSKRLHESSCDDFLKEELPQNYISSDHSKNGYTIRGQLFEPAKQDLGKSCKQFQGNDHDDKMTSIQFSLPAPSHLIAGREMSEVDATYTTNVSFSIRVNKHDKEKNPDTDEKEKSRDNVKHDDVHSSKHPQVPACGGNTGSSFQREDISENDLHINNSKNNDEKQNHRFIKGTNDGRQDGERHALSHQSHTENADIKGKDELIGNRTQDYVHPSENLNESSDESGGTK
ncbi:uncharacterized protein LOC115929322 [Strongylocentrotus purpuratus]|uniref:Uncharacterized protein n=1 Tax=Strongylocentrotus purpuratus TaxID=7668 RepID=A0A7M7PPT8_STRPU|nr:uncharacterized protein LOC115929322 [Strongylocentrotus purpuratus]